jgi:hypothetical protein
LDGGFPGRSRQSLPPRNSAVKPHTPHTFSLYRGNFAENFALKKKCYCVVMIYQPLEKPSLTARIIP